jgi:hypothetical protein
MALSFATSQ